MSSVANFVYKLRHVIAVMSINSFCLTFIEVFHNSCYRTTFSSKGLITFGVQRGLELMCTLVRYGLLKFQIFSLQVEEVDSPVPNCRGV